MKNRNAHELTICGPKAIDRLVKINPDRIIRLFFTQDMAPRYGDICRKLAATRRIYRVVEPGELEKISGSIHHAGVAAVIPLPDLEEPGPLEITAWCKEQRRVVILDNVANSHNLGSMVRTAAFLGIRDIVVSGSMGHDDHLITGSMYRTAEGGMESVQLWKVSNLVEFIDRYGFGKTPVNGPFNSNRGIAFIAADHRAPLDIKKLPESLAKKLGADKASCALAIVMGNEETGVDPEVRNRCLLSARIAGGGDLDSLNVAQAAAIFMFCLEKP